MKQEVATLIGFALLSVTVGVGVAAIIRVINRAVGGVEKSINNLPSKAISAITGR
jgi:hypothetical protein